MDVAELELDLEVFTGPFDLLLTLILREEVDLLEVELADVVISYLDILEARGDLDLEVATEFLVLIAALLELKSRLLLPREEDDLLDELAPGEAAEELLARMLEAKRYRHAADHLRERLAGEHGYRYRSAPRPAFLRQVVYQVGGSGKDRQGNPGDGSDGVYDSDDLASAIGAMLRVPEPIRLEHLAMPRVSVAERLSHLRTLLKSGACDFDDAVKGADRMTVAVTLFALLELYKQGEATWSQEHSCGQIAISPLRHGAGLAQEAYAS